jgi:DNA repair protein RadC
MKEKKRKYCPPRTAIKSVCEEESSYWKHPGGKLRELGAKNLTSDELLAILISTGYQGKTALEVAKDLLNKFQSLEALSNMPLARLLEIKGLGDVKIIRIAAALELGRRTAIEILTKQKKR